MMCAYTACGTHGVYVKMFMIQFLNVSLILLNGLILYKPMCLNAPSEKLGKIILKRVQIT